ncbi:radical SAM protein [Chlorobium limicola]|uniref:Radical SAM core domain-containing protein n=1 Tax=Chlorobium limicola TaxID=1092 RepID=A0A101JN86_CHLLI|nr:radical SAM protein [Chlorobium limicola]KUL29914.1 hypothetical protein ASB62_04880 [Chlorobium limicola]
MRNDTKLLPFAIDVRIIADCNMSCPFCFGPLRTLSIMPIDKAEEIIDIISSLNSRAIIISGGEPTLHEDLPLILKYAKSRKLLTVLSTNGLKLLEIIDEISNYVDWISLPIEAHSQSEHSKLRIGDKKHFNIVLDNMKYIRSNYSNIKLKVGTVVTKLNKNFISSIPDLFDSTIMPDVWKLYQVSYSNFALINKDNIHISNEEFDELSIIAEDHSTRHGIKFVTYSNRERNGKYLFVNPNGDALVIKDNDEYVIGNFFDNMDDVVSLSKRYVNTERLMDNFNKSYS